MADLNIVPVVNNERHGEEITDDKQKYMETEHVEEGTGGIDQVKHEILVEDANKAEDFEHDMTTWQAFKIYKAVSLKFRFLFFPQKCLFF
jgi:hypothetical protein